MHYQVKNFQEVTKEELYDIIRQRIEVFVVEQNCPYQEIDEIDLDAYHTWLENEQGQRVAYARLYQIDGVAHFGRVFVKKSERKKQLGEALLREVCQKIDELYPGLPVEIGAQAYLQHFYEKFGFIAYSEPYLEDGILHIPMRKK